MTGCWLRGFGKCLGGLDRHHWIARGHFRGNKAAQKYIKQHEEYFIVPLCAGHNTGRIADNRKWRCEILRILIVLHGEDFMRELIDGIPSKVRHYELTFDGILGGG